MKSSPWPVPDTAQTPLLRIGAGADERTVADPPGGLVGVAAGGGRGGEIAGAIERDRADRAVLFRFARRGQRAGRSASLHLLQIASRRRSVVKYDGATMASPAARAKASAAGPVSSTAAAGLQQPARGLHRVADVAHRADGAGRAASAPSMIEASSSCSASVFSAAPWPALK